MFFKDTELYSHLHNMNKSCKHPYLTICMPNLQKKKLDYEAII